MMLPQCAPTGAVLGHSTWSYFGRHGLHWGGEEDAAMPAT